MVLIYFTVLTLVSGWSFAKFQFFDFWYFIVALSGGFGIQVGLYFYMKNLIHDRNKKIIVVSGTTSTMAMISCCTHYLVNILPVFAVSGVAAFVAQYQIELFWIGLGFNAIGIIYMSRKVLKIARHT